MRKEVVITGIGVVAPNANGRVNFLRALREGTSGIDQIRSFDTRDYGVHRGGEVKGLENLGRRHAAPSPGGRTTKLALAAVDEALAHAGVDLQALDSERIGIIVGTTLGEVQSIEAVDELWVLGRE